MIHPTYQVGQLVDVGMQEKKSALGYAHWWLIVKDMTEGGKRKLLFEIFEQVFHSRRMTENLCRALLNRAIALTQQKIQHYVQEKQILHMDARVTNVLFPFDYETMKLGVPELIDWGLWSKQTVREPHTLLMITDEFVPRFGMHQAKTKTL